MARIAPIDLGQAPAVHRGYLAWAAAIGAAGCGRCATAV